MKDPRDVHFLSLLTAKKEGHIDSFDGYLFWLKQEQTFLTWLLGITVTGITIGASQLQLWSDLLRTEEIWLLAFLVSTCLLSGFEYRIALNEMFEFNLRFKILAKSVFHHEEVKMADNRKPASDPYEHVLQALFDLDAIKSNSAYLRRLRRYQSFNDQEKALELKNATDTYLKAYEIFLKQNTDYLDEKYDNAFKAIYGTSVKSTARNENRKYTTVKKKFNLLNQLFYWSFRLIVATIFLLILLKS